MKTIQYNQVGDFLFPDLKPEQPVFNSHYARLRYNYLKTNHPGHLLALKAKNELNNHLKEIDIQAQKRMDILMNQLLQNQPAPNKETHQMEWVQHMSNLKQQAEEMILNELIYN